MTKLWRLHVRKFISVLLCLTLLCTVTTIPTKAAEENGGMVAVSRRVEYLKDGSYVIETISVPAIQAYSNTTSGSKSAEYYNSFDQHLFTVTVTGKFTYDGSSAEATSAEGQYDAYVTGLTLTGKHAYTSGASAIAQVSVRYQGIPLSKIVKLTCDPKGNLS